MIIVATWKVILVGLFGVGISIYSHISAVPCPKKYRDMGGEIIRYCELDYGAKWRLKEEHWR